MLVQICCHVWNLAIRTFKVENDDFCSLGKEYLKNYRKWKTRFGHSILSFRPGHFDTIRDPIGR